MPDDNEYDVSPLAGRGCLIVAGSATKRSEPSAPRCAIGLTRAGQAQGYRPAAARNATRLAFAVRP